MKKTKIEQRFENAVNAFFDNENTTQYSPSVYEGNVNLMQAESPKKFTKKADLLVKILKRTFLFFPGAFVLFHLTLASTVVALDASAWLNYPFKLALVLLVSAFMVMFGLGNIRNGRHLLIPASILFSAVSFGLVISLLDDSLKIMENYAIYLTPLALVIPILVKGVIDRTSDKKIGV